VRLAGRLTDAQVPELLQACENHPLVDLNLVDLLSADAAGIDAMRRLRSGGAKLIGTNGYIQIKLDSAHPELA
jgi:CheY-like chemotaxis protein